MKTIRMFYLAFVAFAATVMLSGCDDDVMKAIDLDGIWQGTITGDYYYDRYNSRDRWDTEIQFVQSGVSSRGYGTEVDYSYSSGRTYRSYFNWEVRNARIYMYYDDGYNVVVRDYELYSTGWGMRFRGYFDDYYDGHQLATFDLVKVANWSDRSRAAIEE